MFLRRLPERYAVVEAILFGSRARRDHRADSDLDLAVVLKGEQGDFIDTKLAMAGIAFDVLMETGVLVQPLPLWGDDLAHPERFANPALIRTIAAEGDSAWTTGDLIGKAGTALAYARLLLDAQDSDGRRTGPIIPYSTLR